MLTNTDNLILSNVEDGGFMSSGLDGLICELARRTGKKVEERDMEYWLKGLESRGLVERKPRDERYIMGPKETFHITEAGRRLLDRSMFG